LGASLLAVTWVCRILIGHNIETRGRVLIGVFAGVVYVEMAQPVGSLEQSQYENQQM